MRSTSGDDLFPHQQSKSLHTPDHFDVDRWMRGHKQLWERTLPTEHESSSTVHSPISSSIDIPSWRYHYHRANNAPMMPTRMVRFPFCTGLFFVDLLCFVMDWCMTKLTSIYIIILKWTLLKLAYKGRAIPPSKIWRVDNRSSDHPALPWH